MISDFLKYATLKYLIKKWISRIDLQAKNRKIETGMKIKYTQSSVALY